MGHLLEGAPAKDACREVVLVLMTSGANPGVPVSPSPLRGWALPGLGGEIRHLTTLPLSSIFPQNFQGGGRKSVSFFCLSAQDLPG